MRIPAAIALCVALFLAASAGLAEVRNKSAVAVIIGNKNYAHKRVPEVAFAHRDAKAMARYVARHGSMCSAMTPKISFI